MNNRLNSFAFCIFNDLSFNISFTSFDSHNHSLSSSTTSTLSWLLATNISFICFYFPKYLPNVHSAH